MPEGLLNKGGVARGERAMRFTLNAVYGELRQLQNVRCISVPGAVTPAAKSLRVVCQS